MQERVYQTPILDVADLKRRLTAAWSVLQHHVIDCGDGIYSIFEQQDYAGGFQLYERGPG